MNDLTFCFPDEATAIALLSEYRVDDMWKTSSHFHALLPIGDLYGDAVYDEQGEVITPAPKYDGWHLNLVTSNAVSSESMAYLVEPTNRKIVFAGVRG